MVLLQVWNYSKEITIIFCTEFVDAGGKKCSPARSICCQSSHSPGVSVLVSDLLLHLRICESLEEGRPDVRLALVSERVLHGGHLVLGEDVALAVVGQLTSDRVEDSRHELSSQAEVTT